MGGRSVEKEASFNSGRTVCDHLDSEQYIVTPIFQRADGALFILPWHFLHRGKISDFEQRLETQAQKIRWDDLPNLIDFMYLAIHGRYAEDGILQGFLELLKIPYLGSGILASALCMDKTVQKQLLAAHGVAVPRGITIPSEYCINFNQHEHVITQQLEAAGVVLPYVVKPEREGSSLGVSIVKEQSALAAALHHASTIQPDKHQPVLIEEMIQGMEFSCNILVNYKTGELMPLPPTEIIPESERGFYDYDQKYMPGRATKITPARVDAATLERIQQTCIGVMKLFTITTIARIDGFLTHDGRIVIIDPNTLCGMAPTSFLFRQAAELGMGHTAVINHLIETELHAYGMLKQEEFGKLASLNSVNRQQPTARGE
jgi:D-alanine-D-alanine ligase